MTRRAEGARSFGSPEYRGGIQLQSSRNRALIGNPFSTDGALIIANTEEKLRDKTFRGLFWSGECRWSSSPR